MKRVSGKNTIKAFVGKGFIQSKVKVIYEETNGFILGQSRLGVDKLGSSDNYTLNSLESSEDKE